MNTDERPLPENVWMREGRGLEFDRAVFFTDAVFAIALTLLVVGIAVPEIVEGAAKPSTMLDELGNMAPKFISFFMGFVLIGRYWMAHHAMFSQLRAIDQSLIGINLIYLAVVAFLPFPVALVGEYEENPVSVLLLAACLALISTLEVVQLRHAYRKNLLTKDISRKVYNWVVLESLVPVGVFLITAPIALVSPTICLISWLISIPISIWLGRRSPSGSSSFFLAGRPDKNNGTRD